MCNLYRVSETDNAPLESEILSGLCGGQENNRWRIPKSPSDWSTVVWVGLGVLVLFENSIVCQCTFVAWVCLPALFCALCGVCPVWVCAGGGVVEFQ